MTGVPIIAIDGPSGSGKGTIARQVARHFGWHLLDSGALYRLVALAGLRAGLASGDVAGHAQLAASLDVHFGVDDRGGERVVDLMVGRIVLELDSVADCRVQQCGGRRFCRIGWLQSLVPDPQDARRRRRTGRPVKHRMRVVNPCVYHRDDDASAGRIGNP